MCIPAVSIPWPCIKDLCRFMCHIVDVVPLQHQYSGCIFMLQEENSTAMYSTKILRRHIYRTKVGDLIWWYYSNYLMKPNPRKWPIFSRTCLNTQQLSEIVLVARSFRKNAAKWCHLSSRTMPCLVHAHKTRGLHGLTCQKHQTPATALGTRMHA